LIESEDDEFGKIIWNATEEGKKVERNKGSKFAIIGEKVE
jgi:tRNA (guanine-N7-)-methyltransferase